MAGDERLPGLAEAPQESIVCHVDADCFYAACERLREPALEGEPVVVGMGYEPGEPDGAVATASYEARAHGVESAQAISEALERLPRRADDPPEAGPSGHYRPVDMAYYESVAADVRAILEAVADIVRIVSIDEAYLDVTDRTTWSDVRAYAGTLKDRIDAEVGIPVSVGVAPSMSAAKIASDHDKPDGLTVVPPEAVQSFLEPLPVERLHGVGPVTAGELRGMGLETAGDLARADRSLLRERFGERGRELHRFAAGQDDREVTPRGVPKSFSRESAVPDPTPVGEALYDRVASLAASVADRVTREGALFRTIGVKVVKPPHDVRTRERSLPGPVDDTSLIAPRARELLSEFEGEEVRKVGVRVSNLSFVEADQAALGEWDDGPVDSSPAPTRGQASLDEFGRRSDR